MNCEAAKEYIMKYFDGEQNGPEELQFKQHLKTCTNCSDEFNCMKEAFALLGNAEEIEPPEDFEIKVMERIAALEAPVKLRYQLLPVALYNLAAIISIAMLLLFVLDIRNVDFAGIITQTAEYVKLFAVTAAAMLKIVWNLMGVAGAIIRSLFEVLSTVFEAYYPLIIAAIAILAAIQRLLVMYTPQDRGNA
jgi:predicted anti-sigma-YlaC factor YlaD